MRFIRWLFGGGAFWTVKLPLALALVSVGLGTVGFHQYYNSDKFSAERLQRPPILWRESFLLATGLPLLQSSSALRVDDPKPILLDIARFVGVLIPPYAFLLLLLVPLGERLKRMRVLLWRFSPRVNYAVVCGCGWKGGELVGSLCRKHRKWKVVVIDKAPENAFVRAVRSPQVVTLFGDAANPKILREAQVAHADRVYVVCDSDEANFRIAQQVVALRAGTKGAAPCFVHMNDRRKRYLLAGNLDATLCFNTYETTARRLVERYPFDRFASREDHGRKSLQVAILGNHPIAEAILIQVLRVGHFPPGVSLEIVRAVEDVEAVRREFFRRYPCLAPDAFADNPEAKRMRDLVLPRIEFVQLPHADSELLANGNFLFGRLKGSIASVYLCMDDGLNSLAYASSLIDKLEMARKECGCDIRMFCYFNYPDERNNLILEKVTGNTPGLPLTAFGKFVDECSVEAVEGEELDKLARQVAAHYAEDYTSPEVRQRLKEMNPAERQAFFDLKWVESMESDRDANRQAADHLPVKLRAILPGVRIRPASAGGSAVNLEPAIEGDLPMLADMEHRRWCAQKILEGWLPMTPPDWNKWADNKKEFKRQKIHIDLVPFEALKVEGRVNEKEKDFSQIRGIPLFLRNVGKEAAM